MDKSLFNQLHTQLDEAKARVESWEAKEAEAKQKYEAMIELANQHVAAVESQITFNVGGTLFITTKDTLLRIKDSYFTSLMSSGLWKPQADGTYFIDRNPICFGRIVDYMRYDWLNTSGLSELEKIMLHVDFDYFFPNVQPGVPKYHWLASYANIIQNWLGKPLDVTTCLYKASVDGLTPKAFHERCDEKGPTLTAIRTKAGWIFGGYNPISWVSTGDHTPAKGAFIFTLKNPNEIPPTRYFCNPSQDEQVYNNADFGPTFTNGWTTLSAKWGFLIYFPDGYDDTTGFGKATFTGNTGKKFEVVEIEVYSL